MMKKKLVLKESFFFLIGNVFTQLANFLVIYFLMKRLSLQNFGIYSYVTEYIAIFTFFADAGLTSYAIREVSANPILARQKYISIQGVQVYLSLLVVVLALIVSSVINGEKYFIYISINVVGLALNSLFTPCHAQLIAFHKNNLFLKKNILDGLGILIFLGIGIFFNLSILYFVFLLWVRAFVNFIFYIFVKYSDIQFFYFGKTVFSKEAFVNVMKGVGYFTLVMVSNVIYNKIDILMVEKYLGPTQLAAFAGASKFVYPFMFISGAVMNSVFPRMVKSFVGNDDFVKNVLKVARYLGLLGLFVSMALYIGAGFIFSTLFNHKYDESVDIFRILVWYLFITFLYGPFSNALAAENRVKPIVLVNLVFIFIKILINTYAIPRYKIYGAAFSSIFCEMLLLFIIVYLFFYNKNYSFKKKIIITNNI